MERRIVDDNERVWPKFGDEALLEPAGDKVMMATSSEGDRRQPLFAALCHDEVDAPFFAVARNFAMHKLAACRPTMRTIGMCFKAALIHIHHVVRAVLGDPFTKTPQKPHSFIVIYLRIARRFFYEYSAAVRHG